MFKIGQKVRIKANAWTMYCRYYASDNIDPNNQTIGKVNTYIDGTVSYTLSDIRACNWAELELEPVNQIIFDKVTSVKGNGRSIRVGDTLRCCCKYEVNSLMPVWDSKTGKHLADDPRNQFVTKLIKSCVCPIHTQRR